MIALHGNTLSTSASDLHRTVKIYNDQEIVCARVCVFCTAGLEKALDNIKFYLRLEMNSGHSDNTLNSLGSSLLRECIFIHAVVLYLRKLSTAQLK